MTDFEAFKDAMFKEVVRQCPKAVDQAAWDIRPGVTFQGIEIFYDNRIMQVQPKRLRFVVENDRLSDYAKSLVGTMRGKTLMPFRVDVYRKQDVDREMYYAVGELFGADVFAKLDAAWRGEIEKKLGAVRESVLFRLLSKAALKEVAARMKR